MNDFFPLTGTADDWNTAYYRLEDYLRAHGVVSKIRQSQIILRLLERAARRHETAADHSPVELALREAYAELANWCQRIYPGVQASPARLSSMGRLGFYLINAAENWPNVFLSEAELPADFTQAMQEALIRSGPDLRVSTMVPRSPEISSTSAEEKMQWLMQVLSVNLFSLIGLGFAALKIIYAGY